MLKLYQQCVRVIDSCVTMEQFRVALNYIILARGCLSHEEIMDLHTFLDKKVVLYAESLM